MNAIVSVYSDWAHYPYFAINEPNDFHTEHTTAYIKNLEVFGSPYNTQMVFICIAQWHEYSFPDDANDIEAIFFVNSEDEALNYLSQIKDIQNDAKRHDFELKQSNVIEFISGDIGGKYAQLCGNFINITDHKSIILKYMRKTHASKM